MAVYKRGYRPYDGPLTAERARFLVIPRHALRELAESRLLVFYLALCFVPFLAGLVVVYVANSAPAQALLGMAGGSGVIDIRSEFFLVGLTVQGTLAFFLTAWVAPVLVSPDLVNGALALYLSRPFTRAEYVLGKAAVLFILLSLVTWLPVLGVFSLQAGLAGPEWLGAHLRIPFAIVAGAWTWIAVLTLLGLAVSAWVRWRLVATGSLFAVFFMGAAFGEAWREAVRTPWGRMANVAYLIEIVWRGLFAFAPPHGAAREMFDERQLRDLPVWAAWLGLAAICAFCLWLLERRLRAREVVR